MCVSLHLSSMLYLHVMSQPRPLRARVCLLRRCRVCAETLPEVCLDQHLRSTCRLVPCPLCSRLVLPADRERHIKEACRDRRESCSRCGEAVSLAHFSVHDSSGICRRGVLSCPLCGAFLLANGLAEHKVSSSALAFEITSLHLTPLAFAPAPNATLGISSRRSCKGPENIFQAVLPAVPSGNSRARRSNTARSESFNASLAEIQSERRNSVGIPRRIAESWIGLVGAVEVQCPCRERRGT